MQSAGPFSRPELRLHKILGQSPRCNKIYQLSAAERKGQLCPAIDLLHLSCLDFWAPSMLNMCSWKCLNTYLVPQQDNGKPVVHFFKHWRSVWAQKTAGTLRYLLWLAARRLQISERRTPWDWDNPFLDISKRSSFKASTCPLAQEIPRTEYLSLRRAATLEIAAQ